MLGWSIASWEMRFDTHCVSCCPLEISSLGFCAKSKQNTFYNIKHNNMYLIIDIPTILDFCKGSGRSVLKVSVRCGRVVDFWLYSKFLFRYNLYTADTGNEFNILDVCMCVCSTRHMLKRDVISYVSKTFEMCTYVPSVDPTQTCGTNEQLCF